MGDPAGAFAREEVLVALRELSSSQTFSATDVTMEVDDDPIEIQEVDPRNDGLAHVLRWVGLILAIGSLAAAAAIAVG